MGVRGGGVFQNGWRNEKWDNERGRMRMSTRDNDESTGRSARTTMQVRRGWMSIEGAFEDVGRASMTRLTIMIVREVRAFQCIGSWGGSLFQRARRAFEARPRALGVVSHSICCRRTLKGLSCGPARGAGGLLDSAGHCTMHRTCSSSWTRTFASAAFAQFGVSFPRVD